MSCTEHGEHARFGLFDLTGRRALVTGASRGIGRALAIGLASFGADVMCVARSEADLAETARRATEAGAGRAAWFAGDLGTSPAIADAVQATVEQLGGLDILVNNAAWGQDSPIEGYAHDAVERILRLNLQSCLLLSQAASSALRAGGGGKVINVASIAGVVGLAESTPYVAAKHGLVGLTRALALEWAAFGVQVNALCPGFVRTEMTEESWRDPAVRASIEKRTPARRWGEPADLVGAAVFLASRASEFMTGQLLVVDGGWTAQ